MTEAILVAAIIGSGIFGRRQNTSPKEAPFSTLLAVPVLTALAVTPAQPPCEGWTTREFWETVEPATVRECLSYGYSVDDRSPSENETPLQLAAGFSDDPEVIRVLVEAGASLDASSPPVNRTPLHYAARWNRNPEVVRALLQYEPDVYAVNERGRTPLHLAALFNENPAVVEELARVTPVNVRTKEGGTPLHDAAGRRWGYLRGGPNPSVVEVLLRHGADLSAELPGGVTPLRWAEDRRVVEMIRGEAARREAIRERFLQYVMTRVAVGAVVLGFLWYLLARRRGARRGFSDA